MNRLLTYENMQKLRGNTKFWLSLFHKMKLDAFIKQAQHYLNNCSMNGNATYDSAIVNTIMPEALERLNEFGKLAEKAKEAWVFLDANESSHVAELKFELGNLLKDIGV